MASWINGAINSGYTIVNGTLSGSASSKIACWLEYKILSQSIENNISTIRVYAYLATAQNTSKYSIYVNNGSGDDRGSFKIYANGTPVYERTKRGFATSAIPTPSDFTTQYETSYAGSDNRKFLTVLTDNAASRADAYGEFTVLHDSDGTKQLTLSMSGDFTKSTSIGMVSGSITIALPTIPRSTLPSVGTVTLESAATISLSPASSSFRHTLRAKFGSRPEITIVTKTASTSVSWTPALAEANAAPNATKVVGTLYCDTYSGTTLIGTTAISVTANIPASIVPSVTYTITEAVSGIAAKFGAYVQGKSKLAVSLSPSGAYGSTITSVATTVNGTSYTTNSFTTAVLTGTGSKTMSIVVKDSRGRSQTVTASYTVVAYASPALSGVSMYRCNATGAADHTGQYVSVTLTSKISSVNNLNNASVTIAYKKKSESVYSTTTVSTGVYNLTNTFIVGGSLSNQYAYDIRVGATDYFNTTYVYGDISTADTILSIRNNGLGMAIGKISEKNKFEVGWQAEFHEDVEFKGDVTFSSLAWIRDLIFPIGSIRMTTTTAGATTFLGGTWVAWGTGKVPVGVNTNDTDFNTVEKTGGAKTVSLSTANLPAHSHTVSGSITVNSGGSHTHQAASGTYKVGSGSGSTYKYFTNNGSTGPADTGSGGSHSHTASHNLSAANTGSGTAHSNLQPYITCYFWKRTA